MYLIIPTTLVCIPFCTAIPTSPSILFNCLLYLLYMYIQCKFVQDTEAKATLMRVQHGHVTTLSDLIGSNGQSTQILFLCAGDIRSTSSAAES